MEHNPRITTIAAIGRNRELGKGGDLLWHIPDDLKRFKALTLGHAVVMGRKTWDSLPEKVRPLPGRINIIVTRQSNFPKGSYIVAPSVEEALRLGKEVGTGEVFVMGGGEIYNAALPFTDRLELTLINDENPDADAFFPDYSNFKKKVNEERREHNGIPYSWLTLEK